MANLGIGALIFVGLTFLVAYLAGATYIAPPDAPGVPGKWPVEWVMLALFVLGWATGVAAERAWQHDDQPEREGDLFGPDSKYSVFFHEFIGRVFFGGFALIALIVAVLGLETLGIGGG